MLHIHTEYNGAVAEIAKGEGTTTKIMRFVMEAAYEAALNFWHKKIRPGHFERTAIAEYGYTPRTADYERGKQRRLGHRRPLVASGESEKATERNYIKASGRSASLHMDAGNLGWNPRGGSGVNMREELIATTDEDEQAMGWVFMQSVSSRMRSWHGRFTQRVD